MTAQGATKGMQVKESRLPPLSRPVKVGLFLAGLAGMLVLPQLFNAGGPVVDNMTLALAYVVMALGLNIIVGFAGLLDLGYVAFFAIGAYTMGWLGSSFFSGAGGGEGLHIFVSGVADALPGIHVNFLIVLIFAMIFCAIAGLIIGLPTLRLRGDYIAIVTLAFGEIIHRFAINGNQIELAKVPLIGGLFDSILGEGARLTNGRQGITPVDKIDLPLFPTFTSLDLRPWYYVALGLALVILFVNFRLRDSRLGRAWVALREDEVAAASMGVPLVKTKLMAYGTGAAFGGTSGAFLGSYLNTVNADQFQFSFSIFILAMIILGGLASIWGVVLGAIALSIFNNYLIRDVFNTIPRELGIEFDLTQLSAGIFGFVLLFMMVMRPEGLLPERRRKMELHEDDIGDGDGLFEARTT
jgi:branched-chain amino acid transport system permease protein